MNTKTNAAFYYIAEGYDTKGKALMGRQSAGEGFFKGYAKHAGVDTFYCYGPEVQQFGHFQQSLTQGAGSEKNSVFIPFAEFSRLQEVGCLFLPGPNLSDDAWVRRSFDSRAYSLCGVTHTTATQRIMDSFGALLVDPVQSWDAVVCTSTVVKKTLERVVDEYASYLEERMGVRPQLPVQLPVIPLGVDCDRFDVADKDSRRTLWREKLGIGVEDIAVLYMGRLNFNAKAHPLPMFLALEEAARRTGKKVWLLLTGWFDPPVGEALWREDAKKFCPSVQTVFLDGRQEDVRWNIWHAADIFTSLSDNIQETFGLTPIEAMAAGLPVVVSDWDGYRDTVRHGIDGFRIPVWMPEPGSGEELAVRFANKVDLYGKYCGTVSQMTNVGIGECIMTYCRLIQDQELRSKMGEAGRQRARAQYDWSIIVNTYQELWQELATRRSRDSENAPRSKGKVAMPLRQDPFTLFQEYPSHLVTGECLVTLQGGRIRGWWEKIVSSPMNRFLLTENRLLLTKEEQTKLLAHLLARQTATVTELTALFPPQRQSVVQHTLAWMAKTGMVGMSEAKQKEQ